VSNYKNPYLKVLEGIKSKYVKDFFPFNLNNDHGYNYNFRRNKEDKESPYNFVFKVFSSGPTLNNKIVKSCYKRDGVSIKYMKIGNMSYACHINICLIPKINNVSRFSEVIVFKSIIVTRLLQYIIKTKDKELYRIYDQYFLRSSLCLQ
jgi:hypothetical protein